MQHLIDIARYTEAVTLFKTANDPVWCASALEGMATIPLLGAWSGPGFVRCRTHYLANCIDRACYDIASLLQRAQGALE
jgi:hypothetical protein